MLHSKRSGATIAIGLALALSLVTGCNRSETSSSTPPASTPTPSPSPVEAPAPFAVKGVTLGNSISAEKRVASPNTTFAKGDTIYASVATEGASPSVTLAARWTYEGGQLVSEGSQTIAPTGPTATEFHIAKPDGWPAGAYTVEISANGVVVASQPFTVVE